MDYQPRGRYFDDFVVGEVFTTARRTVTEADVALFAGLSGDYNPLHTDDVYAQHTPFGRRIAHGMLVASIATGLVNQLALFEGTTLALLEATFQWTAPVRPGDTIYAKLTITEKAESKKPDRGVMTLNVMIVNHEEEQVASAIWKLLLARR